METYFTIKLILGFVIPALILALFIVWFLWQMISFRIQKLYKKNCYECKHYGLYDTCGSGSRCEYKCKKFNRIDRVDMNQDVLLMKCKEFESK